MSETKEEKKQKEEAKHAVRRPKRSSHGEGIAEELNITAMMDMMTILLVFLLKSYNTDPTRVDMSESLTVPFSTTKLRAEEAVSVTITKENMLVEGKEIVQLKNWKVNKSLKQGGEDGFLINPLKDALDREVKYQRKMEQVDKKAKFEGKVLIIADKGVPYRLVSEVLYTAGMAELGKYKFMVLKKE
jgi:biopolymer transport protein ExbD